MSARNRVLTTVVAATFALGLAACVPIPSTPTIPGLSTSLMLRMAGHDQVIVASGDGATATQSTVTIYDRTTTGWRPSDTWRAWNGRIGWGLTPRNGSGRSPDGVFTLTAAGGYAANPGTRLPYEYRPSYYRLVINYVRTFNRVVAVDINHVPYSPPSDGRRPAGWLTTN